MQYYFSGRLSQYLLWLATLAGVVGLLGSRALIALSPVAGVLAVLANPRLRLALPQYFRNAAAMRAVALVFFLLLSGIYTSEWDNWRHQLFRSLTWLAVSLAFTLAVPLTTWQRFSVAVLFVLATATVGVVTLGKYVLDPAAANEAIRIGQNMQAATGVFHVAFGLMLALCFFWALLLRTHQLAGPVLRWILLGAAIGMALTLHVLAYRTGLLGLYVGLVAYVVRLLLQRHWAVGLGLLVLTGVGPWLAYHTLPSVQQRVDGTIWDVQQYTQGHDINNYSLAQRLAAIETATAIVGQHWLLGVGPADTHAAMMEQYRWHDFGLSLNHRVDVHNQYIDSLLGGGLVGLALWLAVLLGPLTQPALRRNPYIVFFILIQAVIMLFDDMLSLQIGLNLFVFCYGFLIVAEEARSKQAALGNSSQLPAATSQPPI